MEIKKALAGWSNICPGCNIGRKYPRFLYRQESEEITGRKVASHITPMLRCTAVTAFTEQKAREPPTINEFAISREEAGCHTAEISSQPLNNFILFFQLDSGIFHSKCRISPFHRI